MPTNWAPFNVLVGPADVYIAATAVSPPAVNATPGGSFTLLGKTEGGVTVRHPQTVNQITADQNTGPIKAVRTDENIEIEFSLVEMTLENYSFVLNSNTVVSAGGPPAIKTLQLHRDVNVDLRSMLIRGRSPYGNFNAQYQVPVVYQAESPEVSHVKDDKQVLHCVWTALEDLSAGAVNDRFGQLVAQTS